MTPSDGAASPPPTPGDLPPAGRLSRPPSDRYAPRPAGGVGDSAAGGGTRTARPGRPALRALWPAVGAGIGTAAVLVLVGGVLAERTGLLAIAGLGAAALGLLAANAAVSPDGVAPPAMARGRATWIAVGLAIASIVAAALGTWAYGRLEGGVMDPLSYLWETQGLLVPVQLMIAGIAAAWGAGAGPVRLRS